MTDFPVLKLSTSGNILLTLRMCHFSPGPKEKLELGKEKI